MESTGLLARIALAVLISGFFSGCTSIGHRGRSSPEIAKAIEPTNEFGFDSDDGTLSVGIEKLLTERGYKTVRLRKGVHPRYVLRTTSVDFGPCIPEGSQQLSPFNVVVSDSDTGERFLIISGEHGCTNTILKRFDEWLPKIPPNFKPAVNEPSSTAVASAPSPSNNKTVQSNVDKPRYMTAQNPNNYAVVIGVEKYASLPAADFAERDAESVRAHLMALGYPTRNIYFLSGQQATRAKIDQSLNTWLPNRVGDKSTVFFFYSGHGAPDPKTNQAYLVPVDGDAEDLGSTAYPIKQLYAKLGNLKAHQVIVALDSCFSGAGGRSVLARGTRPLVSTNDLGALPNNVIALDLSPFSGPLLS